MVDPILPTADEVLRPGVETLTALRPNALPYINTGTGVWSRIIAGLRAQVELELVRLSDAVKSQRLNLSEGTELRNLIQSEYAPLPSLDPVAAVGTVTLTRTGSKPQGIIKKGTKFNRLAVGVATPMSPALPPVRYKAAQDIFVPNGTTSIDIPLVADQTGTSSNQPLFTGLPANIQIGETLFDSLFTVVNYSMAGGSNGFSDPELRSYARAYVSGQYAPNDRALIAGALGSLGVKHAAISDSGLGTSIVWAADGSWASSPQWTRFVKQSLYTNKWVGFGCVADVQGVTNIPVGISCTLRLTDATAIFDTAEISAAVIAAAQNYFDTRQDWYIWRTKSLKAVVSRAHEKILSCPTLTVVDANGNPLAEPSITATTLYHYRMDENGLKATFQFPT